MYVYSIYDPTINPLAPSFHRSSRVNERQENERQKGNSVFVVGTDLCVCVCVTGRFSIRGGRTTATEKKERNNIQQE